jgi:hypothetical protein
LTLGTVKGTVIDISEIYHNVSIENFDSSQDAVLDRVQGLGTNRISLKLGEDQRNCFKQAIQLAFGGAGPLVPVTLTAPFSAYVNNIYVVLAVEYSGGLGLSATPQGSLSSDTQIYPSIVSTSNPVIVEDVAEIPDMLLTTSPQGFFREGVRELALEYVPGNAGANDPSEADIADRGYHEMAFPVWPTNETEIRVPFKVHYQDSDNPQASYEPLVIDNQNNIIPLDLANSTLGETNTVLKFAQVQGAVNAYTVYIYRREALPNYGANGLRVSAYYRRVAPQTCSGGYGANLASQSVTVRILSTNSKVSVLQFGHGSSQVGYPYVSPTDQIGVSPNISFDESKMRGSLNVDLNGFSVGTGYVELPSVLPLDVTGDLTVGGPAYPPLVDNEGRLVYPMVDEGYLPNSFAQPLSSYVQHKNMVSFLAKIVDQSNSGVAGDVFQSGEVVLVVLSRVTLDEQNKVTISPNDPSSVICIYRTKGLILTAGE